MKLDSRAFRRRFGEGSGELRAVRFGRNGTGNETGNGGEERGGKRDGKQDGKRGGKRNGTSRVFATEDRARVREELALRTATRVGIGIESESVRARDELEHNGCFGTDFAGRRTHTRGFVVS